MSLGDGIRDSKAIKLVGQRADPSVSGSSPGFAAGVASVTWAAVRSPRGG